MYTWTRITQFKNVGSMMAGLPICAKIAEHMNKELGQEAHLMTPVLGGHPSRVLFVIKSADVNDALAKMNKANQDPKFRELVGKLAEYVDGSVTVDQLWQDVP